MTATLEDVPQLGEGIYTFPEAARILSRRNRQLTSRQLRYWMDTGLAPTTCVVDGQPLLTFHDLISLEVVARFVDDGRSVQWVRHVEEELREEFGRDQPFAHKVFYTDGRSVWAKAHEDDSTMTELIGRHHDRRHKSLAWAEAVETFAQQIRFDGVGQSASAWELTSWVEIDPAIQFGTPLVRGTRVPVSTVAANLEVGAPEEVADWYGLTVDEVNGVRDYLACR